MPTPAAATVPDSLADLPHLLQTAEGFAPLAEALRAGQSGSVDGAWGSAAALAIAALTHEAPEPVLVVIPHPADLDALAGDLRSLTGVSPASFPALDSLPDERPRFDAAASTRLRLIQSLSRPEPPRLVLATMQALMQPVPAAKDLAARSRPLRVGEAIDVDELSAWLVGSGYKRVDAVELPGEFSRRGGIFDIYSQDADAPYRLELFGDEVESLRQFAADTQRSLGDLESASVLSLPTGPLSPAESRDNKGQGIKDKGHLTDYLPDSAWTVLMEPDDLREQGRHFLDRAGDAVGLFSVAGTLQQLVTFPSVTVSALPAASVESTWHLRVESVERFSGNVARIRDELDQVAAVESVLIACHNDAEVKRLTEVLSAGRLAQSDRLRLVKGHVQAGYRLVEAGVVVLGSHELFHREDPIVAEPGTLRPRFGGRKIESRAIDSFLDLAVGDLVVHVSHGIARFRGMVMLDRASGGGGGG
ncbi:MAG TPA: CarD family transcriptional regulator, partial [Gemmataceae bacterium]|nr:CarD family transcriptional regulator [Gemmataceae bacterium]